MWVKLKYWTSDDDDDDDDDSIDLWETVNLSRARKFSYDQEEESLTIYWGKVYGRLEDIDCDVYRCSLEEYQEIMRSLTQGCQSPNLTNEQ